MKKPLLSILFISIIFYLTAQEKPSFIGLQAGTSIPVGKFHGTVLNEDGFAQAGFSASLEGAWFFKPWIGAGGSAGIYLHPVDVATLEQEKIASDPFLTELGIRSDPYTTVSLYAGLFFHVPLFKKLSFTAKAMGGMIYARTPYQLYKAEYQMIGKNWYEKTAAGDYEGSFLAGAGFRYDLNDWLGFAMNTEFTYNQCEFDFSLPGGSVRTDHIDVSFVNLALGIIFKL